jgi:excisionase family DNA binding protein
MNSNENYQYLSVKRVAELLGFHPETIKRWARDGKIEIQQAGHYGQIRVKWPLEKPGRTLKNTKFI